jgi:voltage-gated potassium channel Kch
MLEIAGDHAAEVRAELLDFERAEAAERYLPDDAQWLWRRERGRWLDQLGTLTLPVLAIVPGSERFVGETIGRIAKNLETLVVTEQGIVPPSTAAARDQVAAAIERLLDRIAVRGVSGHENPPPHG